MSNTVLGITITANSAQAEAALQRVGIAGTKSGNDIHAGAIRGREGIDASSAAIERLSSKLGTMGHSVVAAFGISQIQQFTQSIVDARIAMDAFNAKMTIATGSQAKTAVEYEHIRNLANKLGVELRSTADAYASFAAAARGTSLEGIKAREVFSGVATASAKMSLSVDAQQGVFYALSQMMSKGVVSAEEFRQQLGERLPIATSAGAKALNLTTKEFTDLLNSGKILSEDFLPKFAKTLTEMAGGSGPIDNMQASINRLSNQFTEYKQSFDVSIIKNAIDVMAGSFGTLTKAAEALTVGAAAFGALKAGEAVLSYVSAIHAQKVAALAAAEAELTRTNMTYAATAADRAAAVSAVARAEANMTLVGSMKAMALANPFLAIAAGVTAVYQAFKGLQSSFDEAVNGFNNFQKRINNLSSEQLGKERQLLIAEMVGMKNSVFKGFYEKDIRMAEDKISMMDALIAKQDALNKTTSTTNSGAQNAPVTETAAQASARAKAYASEQKRIYDEAIKQNTDYVNGLIAHTKAIDDQTC